MTNMCHIPLSQEHNHNNNQIADNLNRLLM